MYVNLLTFAFIECIIYTERERKEVDHMMNLNYATKTPHGLTRDLLIEEMLLKAELLDEVGHDRGLEDDLTIELYRMKERGETYAAILDYKNTYENAEANEWFGFEM